MTLHRDIRTRLILPGQPVTRRLPHRSQASSPIPGFPGTRILQQPQNRRLNVRPPTTQLRGRLHHKPGSTGFGPARSAFGRAGRAFRRTCPCILRVHGDCCPPILLYRHFRPSHRLHLRRRARSKRCCPVRELIVLQAARVCRPVAAADRIPSGGRCAGGAPCRAAGGECRFNWVGP